MVLVNKYMYCRSKSEPHKNPGVQMRNKTSNIPSAAATRDRPVERPRSVDISATATPTAAGQSKATKDKVRTFVIKSVSLLCEKQILIDHKVVCGALMIY